MVRAREPAASGRVGAHRNRSVVLPMTFDNSPSRRTSAANDPLAGREREQRVEIKGTEARAGVTGPNVRYVLGFGTIAVIIAFAVILYFNLHMK
jgi:hypothetical protein